VEDNRIEPVPDEDKTSTALDQFWIWFGANVAPINWILGALGIVLGLGFWDTILVLAVGNALGVTMFGFFVLMGQRTGVNQMVLSRGAFGRRGAYLPATFQMLICAGWIGINTWIVLDVALKVLEKMGIHGGSAVKVVVVLVIMAIQIAIATLGFYAIRNFEKWTVPVTIVVLAVMSIVAWTKGGIHWNLAGKATGSDRVTAMSQLMTAIGIGWGFGWLAYASDYSRFVPRSVPPRKLFVAAALGQFIPVMWLGILGASIATMGTGADPAVMVTTTFGALALPVLLLIMHGPIATNILNIYSSSMAALTMDWKISRYRLSLLIGAIATAFTVYLVFQNDIASKFDAWLAGLVMWMSPWAAIMFVHYYVIKRRNIDVEALYDEPHNSRVGDVRWGTVVAFVAGLAAAWSFEYGLVGPLQGPLSKSFNNIDLSWLAGLLVAGGIYYAVCRFNEGREAVSPVVAAETTEVSA
jgi:NCS1 nucleoside transporter family